MTIKKDNKIVYKDLIENTFEKIKSVCDNYSDNGTWKSTVPILLRGNGSRLLNSMYVPNYHKPPRRKRCHDGEERPAHTSEIRLVVNDPLLTTVTGNTIRTEFEAFLKSRGVYSQLDETVTFKDMMLFYNNVASFLASKLVYVISPHETGCAVFYVAGNVNYTNVNIQNGEIRYISKDYVSRNKEKSASETSNTSLKPLYRADWLSTSHGGNPVAPEKGNKYTVKSEGDFMNHSYYWTGESYVTDEEYSIDEIKTSVKDLLDAIGTKNNVHYVLTTLTYLSCSCSSSSSCSSSCSSSSSSIFIAYMDI